MKSSRQTKIIEIITENNVRTQEELIERLRKNGYDVTQATVSRDIKQLGLLKSSDGSDGYKYVMPKKETVHLDLKFRNILKETVIRAVDAENIVVIKTYSGMANAAAAAVDALSGDTIIGSIAGDDTIFVVTKDDSSANDFSTVIKSIIEE